MTDDKLRNIIRDEFGKIHADENVKAQILKGLTGDTMKTEKRESIITANAENKEKTIVKETNGGKARVAQRGRIAAVAAALVLCVGGGAYLLRDKDLPDTEASHTSSIADTEDCGSGNMEPVEFDGYFNENGYTVFDKFGDISEVWRLPNGKFLVRQNASNDTAPGYYYIVFNGETNSVEKVMESSLYNVCVYNNGFSLKDELAKTEFGSESTYAEFYDFDLNLVNKFSFKPEETGEVIDAATCASDGSALYVKTSGNGFTGFYKFTNDKGAEPLYMLKVAEKSSADDIDMLFSSDDGNTLFFIGPNWQENENDTIETSYRLCAFTAGSYSEFYMPYESKTVLERNNMMYIFSLSSAEYKVYQPDAEPGTDNNYPIGCEYTFGNETFGNKPHLINMSQSGKYVIAASWISDDDGNITDTLLTVYELDGMKEIFTDTISGSVDLLDGQFIFDEATGDICAVQGNVNGETDVYTANAFGNEYSNFGIKQTVSDNSSDARNETAVTTTIPSEKLPDDVENDINADKNKVTTVTLDGYVDGYNYNSYIIVRNNPIDNGEIIDFDNESEIKQVVEWYEKFINANYKTVKLSGMNMLAGGVYPELCFTYANVGKICISAANCVFANVKVNGEYYVVPDDMLYIVDIINNHYDGATTRTNKEIISEEYPLVLSFFAETNDKPFKMDTNYNEIDGKLHISLEDESRKDELIFFMEEYGFDFDKIVIEVKVG